MEQTEATTTTNSDTSSQRRGGSRRGQPRSDNNESEQLNRTPNRGRGGRQDNHRREPRDGNVHRPPPPLENNFVLQGTNAQEERPQFQSQRGNSNRGGRGGRGGSQHTPSQEQNVQRNESRTGPRENHTQRNNRGGSRSAEPASRQLDFQAMEQDIARQLFPNGHDNRTNDVDHGNNRERHNDLGGHRGRRRNEGHQNNDRRGNDFRNNRPQDNERWQNDKFVPESSKDNNNNNSRFNTPAKNNNNNNQDRNRSSGKKQQQKKQKDRYAPYITPEQVEAGLKNKTLFQGNVRINAHNTREGYVTCDGLELDVFIDGQTDRNRSLEGDIVIVEITTDVEKWKILKDAKDEAEEKIDQDADPVGEKSDEEEPAEGTPMKAEVDGITQKMSSTTVSDPDTAVTLTPEGPMQKGRTMSQKSPFVNKAGQNVQPSGKVVYLVEEKRSKQQIGFLDSQSEDGKVKPGDHFAVFKPTDIKIPKMSVPINTIPDFYSKSELYHGKLVHVEMTSWTTSSWRPKGKFVRVMGEAGEIQPETDAFLCVNRITWADQPWSNDILKDLPNKQYEISDEEISQRKDLRKYRIFSIDPPTARDLDDALHITKLDNGNFEVGVHIADVSYFVRPGSPLDKEALNRATTVYLIQKAITMLPNVLCENLCSLNPGVDRMAFSVIFTLSPEGKVLDEWFGRTVIRSCSKMSYNVAQLVIEGKLHESWDEVTDQDLPATHPQLGPYDGHTTKQMAEDISSLHNIAMHLRKGRYLNGAITMNNSKLGFKLDENGNPSEVFEYITKEANHMIEEFMLLANLRVAKKIAKAFPDIALLRNHPHPVERRLEGFAALCAELNLDMDVSDSKKFSDSLDLLRKSMLKAKFSAVQRSALGQCSWRNISVQVIWTAKNGTITH